MDVVVVNGQVTQLSFAEPEFTGEVPDPQRFGPVSELFAFVEDAVARDAARIDLRPRPRLSGERVRRLRRADCGRGARLHRSFAVLHLDLGRPRVRPKLAKLRRHVIGCPG